MDCVINTTRKNIYLNINTTSQIVHTSPVCIDLKNKFDLYGLFTDHKLKHNGVQSGNSQAPLQPKGMNMYVQIMIGLILIKRQIVIG